MNKQYPIDGKYKFLSAKTNPTVNRRLEEGRNVEIKIIAAIITILLLIARYAKRTHKTQNTPTIKIRMSQKVSMILTQPIDQS